MIAIFFFVFWFCLLYVTFTNNKDCRERSVFFFFTSSLRPPLLNSNPPSKSGRFLSRVQPAQTLLKPCSNSFFGPDTRGEPGGWCFLPSFYWPVIYGILIYTGGRKNNKHFRPADGKFANGWNERIQRYCKVA